MQLPVHFLRVVVAVIFLAVFTGCNSQKSKSDVSAGLDSSEFSFRWPVPTRFEVEETIKKKGSESTIRHTIQFRSRSNELVLRWVDSEVLSINGQLVKTPAEQKAVASLRAIFAATAPMRVSTAGEFLGCLNNEESIRKINKELDAMFPDRPQSARDYYTKLGSSEEGQAWWARIMNTTYWGPWVGAWVDFDLRPGERATNIIERGSAQTTPRKEIISTHLGSVPKKRELVHLRLESRSSGPELWQAIAGQVDKVAEQTIDKKDRGSEPLPKVLDAAYSETVEVHTDPKSLRPSWVKRSTLFTAVPAEGAPVTNRESREYFFKWNNK